VPFDTNGTYDVFVRDRLLRTTECVSVAPNGRPGNGPSGAPVISADGRYVAFNSGCTDLVPGDSNDRVDLFVRDRDLDSTLRVSIGPGNVEGNGDSGLPAITPDGRFIAFSSTASNLVPGDTNNHADVFVVDRLLGTLERASLTYTGGQATDSSAEASISADGRYVAWHSIAQDFVAGDNNGGMDVFLRDRASGTTERVSLTSGGSQANGQSYSAALSDQPRARRHQWPVRRVPP
jgi:Tol biopolymer transport system component